MKMKVSRGFIVVGRLRISKWGCWAGIGRKKQRQKIDQEKGGGDDRRSKTKIQFF